MKKFILLSLLAATCLGFSAVGCTPTTTKDSNTTVDSTGGTTVVNTGYKINHSTATMIMGDELQLSITNNGTKVNNIKWTSSDTDLARVDDSGKVCAYFFTGEGEEVTITGKINNTKSLTCTLKINPRTDSIFDKCYHKAQKVSQTDDGHIVYMFVHGGTEADGTILVEKTFEYDSYTNICKIKVSKSYVDGGVRAYYIGWNLFYWGDYRNGLFYGQYLENNNDVVKGASFSFYNIGFSSYYHTIMLQDATTYVLEESDWTTINDESHMALGVFYRIQECSEYAEEKFTQYNFGIHLF